MIKEETYNFIALIDSWANLNCIQDGIIPTKYYEKTKESLSGGNGSRLIVSYKLSKVKICKSMLYNHIFITKNYTWEYTWNSFSSLLCPFFH